MASSGLVSSVVKNIAGLTAATLTAGAVVAGATPIGLSLLTLTAVCLVTQSWIDANSKGNDIRQIENWLEELIRRQGNMQNVLHALTTGEVAPHEGVCVQKAATLYEAIISTSVNVEVILDKQDKHESLLVYIGGWLEQHGEQVESQLEQLTGGQEITHEKLAAIGEQLSELLANKSAGEDPTTRSLTPEQEALIERALEQGDVETKAKAAIAAGKFDDAEHYLAEAMKPVLGKAFDLFTTQGDLYYYQGRYDDAIEPYENAWNLDNENQQARTNLALVLQRARLGSTSDNIIRAIKLHDNVLSSCTFGDQDWVMTLIHLGIAWSNLLTGNREQNLRKSIKCYQQVLEVITRDKSPREWATIHSNLGNSWGNLPTSNPSMTLSESIRCSKKALEVFSQKDHPDAWAGTLNNLGNAWRNLPTGDRTGNIEQAIKCYDQSLKVYTREDHPVDWAMTLNNLGNAWRDLPTGDRAGNIFTSIDCFHKVLEVWTKEAFPHYHKIVKKNLKIARDNLDKL